MKSLTLSLLLLCLGAISQAQAPSTQAKTDQSPVQSLRSTEPFYFNAEPDRARSDEIESFCAYMRTYRVKRQQRDSDVVTPAGYTKCAPSKRFELRSALQVETEPDSRE